jgi:hypothetical protein
MLAALFSYKRLIFGCFFVIFAKILLILGFFLDRLLFPIYPILSQHEIKMAENAPVLSLELFSAVGRWLIRQSRRQVQPKKRLVRAPAG